MNVYSATIRYMLDGEHEYYCDLDCNGSVIAQDVPLASALQTALGLMQYGDKYVEIDFNGNQTESTGLIEGLLTEASVQAFQHGHARLAKDIFNLITKHRAAFINGERE